MILSDILWKSVGRYLNAPHKSAKNVLSFLFMDLSWISFAGLVMVSRMGSC